jgi:hypothetical protein
VAAPGENRRQYEEACRRVERLLDVATNADAKGILVVPRAPIEAAVAALRSVLGCRPSEAGASAAAERGFRVPPRPS